MKFFSIRTLTTAGLLACSVWLSSCSQTHCVGISGTGNTATATHKNGGGKCVGVSGTGTIKPKGNQKAAKQDGLFDPKMNRKVAKSNAKPIENKKLSYK